jgi:hypothetical protein
MSADISNCTTKLLATLAYIAWSCLALQLLRPLPELCPCSFCVMKAGCWYCPQGRTFTHCSSSRSSSRSSGSSTGSSSSSSSSNSSTVGQHVHVSPIQLSSPPLPAVVYTECTQVRLASGMQGCQQDHAADVQCAQLIASLALAARHSPGIYTNTKQAHTPLVTGAMQHTPKALAAGKLTDAGHSPPTHTCFASPCRLFCHSIHRWEA